MDEGQYLDHSCSIDIGIMQQFYKLLLLGVESSVGAHKFYQVKRLNHLIIVIVDKLFDNAPSSFHVEPHSGTASRLQNDASSAIWYDWPISLEFLILYRLVASQLTSVVLPGCF